MSSQTAEMERIFLTHLMHCLWQLKGKVRWKLVRRNYQCYTACHLTNEYRLALAYKWVDFCSETKREHSRTRDRGRQSGGASNQCACVCVCVSQPPEIMQASNNEQIEPPHTETHTVQGQAQRQGSRGVLAVGGSEKQIMINWLTFYKTLPLMHLG